MLLRVRLAGLGVAATAVALSALAVDPQRLQLVQAPFISRKTGPAGIPRLGSPNYNCGGGWIGLINAHVLVLCRHYKIV